VSLTNLRGATIRLLNGINKIESLPEWIIASELILNLVGVLDTIELAEEREAEEGRIKVIYG
jgi:hypothetical protein